MTFFLIFFIGLFFRFFILDSLPAAMWGDVIEHYKLAQLILDKKFFYHYNFGGDGPLISYIIAFFSKFFGLSFYTIKLTTAVLGSIWILINYFLGKEFFKNKKIGYLTAYLTAVGFWGVTFSRQGKPYLLAGLMTSLFLYFFLKKRYFISGLILGLGMYSQVSFWGISFFAFKNFFILLGFLIISLPLFISFLKQPDLLFNSFSYLGEKFIGSLKINNFFSYFLGIINNYLRNILMIFFPGKGDRVFRHNIPFSPALDWIMIIFFFIGLGLMIKGLLKEKKKKFYLLFLTMIFSIFPTSLDVKNYLNNPSMGRTLGMVSIIYMIIAYGIYKLSLKFKNDKKIFYYSIVSLLIFSINFYHYFFVYPKTLPNQNIPFDRIIARGLDGYDEKIPFVLVDCCWGEWGQPEPTGIVFQMKKKREYYFINSANFLDFFNNSNLNKALIIVPPFFSEDFFINQTKDFHILKKTKIMEKNFYIADLIYIKK